MNKSAFATLGKKANIQGGIDNIWNRTAGFANGVGDAARGLLGHVPMGLVNGAASGNTLGSVVQGAVDGTAKAYGEMRSDLVSDGQRMTTDYGTPPATAQRFDASGSTVGAPNASAAATPPVTVPQPAPAPTPAPMVGPPAPLPMVGPPAPAPAAAPAVAPSGPTAAQLAQFHHGTASNFDPHSRLDRAKMQSMNGGAHGWASNSAARQAMHAPIAKSAFARLEKQAGGLAGGLAKLLERGGSKLIASGEHAAGGALSKAIGAMEGGAAPDVAKKLMEGAERAGGFRQSIGGHMGSAAERISSSPGIQAGINYGAGGLAAAGGMYGANRMGHSSGLHEGADKGFDTGVETGIESMSQQAAPESSVFDRIANVFTNAQQSQGPSAGAAYQNIGKNRDALIQSILSRK